MSKSTLIVTMLSAGAFVAVLTPAASAAMFFTSQSIFESQASGLSQVTFAGLTDAAGCQADPFSPSCFAFEGGSFSSGSLTFTSPSATLNVIDPAFLGPAGPFSLFGVPVLTDTSSVSQVSVQLPAGTRNAGLRLAFSGLIQPATTATISLSDGSTQGFSLSGTSQGFIGFNSAVPITSFTLTGTGGGGFETPLVEFGSSTSSVPEPSQASLLLVPLVVGYFILSRRSSI